MKKNYMKLSWKYDPEASGYDLYKVVDHERKLIISILDNSISEMAIPVPDEKTEFQIFSIDTEYGIVESSCQRFLSPSIEKKTPAKEAVIKRITAEVKGILIQWLPSDEADRYFVFRMSENEPVHFLGVSAVPEFIDTSYEKDVLYTYIVMGCEKGMTCDALSKGAAGTTFTCFSTPVMTNVVYYNDYVDVQWKAAAGASKFRVYRKTPKDRWKPIGDTEKSYLIDTEVVAGETYCYTVRCMSEDLQSHTSLFDRAGLEVTC